MWPMPLDVFLAEGHLRRGDIVLGGGNTIFSRLIREATGSRFSHAGLVFAVPNVDDGFEKAFIIESAVGGVDLRDLETMARPGYELAIKRLEAPWFTPELAKLVRGHMLNHIKDGYDVIELLRMAWAALTGRPYRNSRVQAARFLCSGFVQYGFASTVAIKSRENYYDVLFADRLGGNPSVGELLSVTPEELAKTPKLAWKFVVRDGLVYSTDCWKDAASVLR